jgi:hypothetical protein
MVRHLAMARPFVLVQVYFRPNVTISSAMVPEAFLTGAPAKYSWSLNAEKHGSLLVSLP